MGKKKSSSSLGRAIIKDKNMSTMNRGKTDSWLHTSEIGDGYNWGRLNLQSVTEQSSLDEFLTTAELAGTEFIAEKLNVKIVSRETGTGLLTAEERKIINELQEENRHFLRIPRRPPWDENTSSEALQQAERETFLEWRRQLAQLEENQELTLTPFERNLDVWRQLWRVIERSDIVVQIVDARNPLLFRCQDLECYVKEVGVNKENVLLINKADLLTSEQRQIWAQYFEKEGINILFWSAVAENKRLDAEAKEQQFEEAVGEHTDSETEECQMSNLNDYMEGQLSQISHADSSQHFESDDDDAYEDCREEEEEWQTCSEDGDDEWESSINITNSDLESEILGKRNLSATHLLHQHELIEVLKTLHTGKTVKEGELTVGLVGYPNVGKSSTINTILRNKKVSVSATPGHTKHFQTLYVEPGFCLCDCPGLVMPSFVSTKAEMICNGILPIDQIRDHVPAVSLVCHNIPRFILESKYGITITSLRKDDHPDWCPTAEELLSAYGCMRGFMTAHGQPDQPRSARYILKDYVSGKLLYCHPPPAVNPKDFQYQHKKIKNMTFVQESNPVKGNGKPKARRMDDVIDESFFHQENVQALTRGIQNVMGYRQQTSNSLECVGKPWKKHFNSNKKEKMRRLKKHLNA
ncbi:large subunit GTPase 1 homolog [Protopterus annectens]|uniref:large subunit GTPase 1 homolog n=1 Tax=Protopterus annectens TaxID=7888 RepID=UPI001CFB93CB|nr:large subunit GTPase 1 homolog [Protopterus annectens]